MSTMSYLILDSHAFKKYSTWWVFQALSICVFVYVCICVCVFVIVFVISERQWIVKVMGFQKIYDLRGPWGLTAVFQLIYELRKNWRGWTGRVDGTGRDGQRLYKRSSRT